MKLSPLPLAHLLRSRLRLHAPPLEASAARTWIIAPGETATVPPAFFLPDQLERVRAWVFADEHPGRDMRGGHEIAHGPTRAALLRDVWLVDGVLYKGRAALHLRPRRHRLPRFAVEREIDRAALVCTPSGNRWFGMWLLDDCPRYALAIAEGRAVTTDGPTSAHVAAYERWLDVHPERVGNAFFRELVLFDDTGQNRHKQQRFAALRERLRSRVDTTAHPGVFILRGHAGERRLLTDELALAERLRRTRGLRVIDPLTTDVPTIVAACAGARVVVGVEGSALVHGVMPLAPGAAVLTLQPPQRFCAVYKHIADREGHRFGFVVGTGDGASFRVDTDEVERTLDLLG